MTKEHRPSNLRVGTLNDLESLAYELIFAMEDMQRQRVYLRDRIERIGIVMKAMERLLPSTREMATRVSKGDLPDG